MDKETKKGAVALIQAHKHCKLANVRLLAPAKNRFSYILHPFKILLLKKDSIEYMHGPMPGVGYEIKTFKPSNEY